VVQRVSRAAGAADAHDSHEEATVPDTDIVILSAVRTAQGRFQGGFSDTPAQELGAIAMKEALDRAGVTGDQLDEVIFGNVIQAGLGQNVARQAELKAGIPDDIPAVTVNRVCVSSATAMAMAAAAIKAGDGEVYLVGGTENMTRAPWLLQNGRKGYRMGMPSDEIFDAMVLDGLWCAIGGTHMGLTAENLSERFGISKELQNDVAYRSQLNATAAITAGRFKDEIAPVVIPQRKGDPKVVDTDECPRETTPEALAALRPVFKKDGGVVTAGNASAIADGASALVVTSRKKAAELGAKPIAQLVSYATAAVEPAIMGLGETVAAQKALEKAGMAAKDVQLAELNEAFACVAALATRELGLDPDIVNVNGGAVALGHPLGNTGTRMVVTLIHELKKRGQEIGLTGACVGGGQGAGSVIKVEG
jgi:acetyl-CoA C-acetyltransferase